MAVIKEGGETPFEKKVGYRVFERVVGLERWISNCRLPAPVFVSIEEEEEEGKKTITRGKNGGRHHLIVVGERNNKCCTDHNYTAFSRPINR